MNKIISLVLWLALTAAAVSCKKDRTFPPPDLGRDYFPVKTGAWIQYKVDSITWNDFYQPVRVDTFSFYIKLKIDTSFIDNEGRPSFVWRKYYKTDSTSWQLIKNYSITKTSSRVETWEENTRFVKMAFPVKNTTVWDMNIFNTNKATESYYEDYNVPKTINFHTYDSCAVVIHSDLETLVSKDLHKEIFAKHIGMVHRTEMALEKDETTGQYTSGYAYSYTILKYGND